MRILNPTPTSFPHIPDFDRPAPFSERWRVFNEIGRAWSDCEWYARRVGVQMRKEGRSYTDAWELPAIVSHSWDIAFFSELFNISSTRSFQTIADYRSIINACVYHERDISRTDIDWIEDEDLTDWLTSLEFLLSPTAPKQSDLELLHSLHDRSDEIPRSYDKAEASAEPLTQAIQADVTRAILLSEFRAPKSIELGDPSLQFGKFLMGLSNWVCQVEAAQGMREATSVSELPGDERPLTEVEMEIMQVMRAHPGEELNSKEISKRTRSGYDANYLRKYLPILKKRGLLTGGRGKPYRLAE